MSISDNCSAIGADPVHLFCAHSGSLRKRMLIWALADKEILLVCISGKKHVNHFAYLFIFCIDLLTSARSGHSG